VLVGTDTPRDSRETTPNSDDCQVMGRGRAFMFGQSFIRRNGQYRTQTCASRRHEGIRSARAAAPKAQAAAVRASAQSP
jgi:hypothetical protein